MTVMKIQQPVTYLKFDQLEPAIAQIVAKFLSFKYIPSILSNIKYIIVYCAIITYMSKYGMTKILSHVDGGVAFACLTPTEGPLRL